jgi:hypothetical protein
MNDLYGEVKQVSIRKPYQSKSDKFFLTIAFEGMAVDTGCSFFKHKAGGCSYVDIDNMTIDDLITLRDLLTAEIDKLTPAKES